MAVKTITIDLESYGLLARHKKAGASFSDVIKAHFGRQPTVATFLATLKNVQLSERTLDAAEAQVARRRSSPARAARL